MNSSTYYQCQLKPYLEKIMNFRYDFYLTHTIENALNHIESLMAQKTKTETLIAISKLDVISKNITVSHVSQTCYNIASQEEKQEVLGLPDVISNFISLYRSEYKPEEKNIQTRERLGYNPLERSNTDTEHRMEKLVQPIPIRDRL